MRRLLPGEIGRIMAVWLAAFAAGNWWLLLVGLMERPALRMIYTLSWAALVLVMAAMTRQPAVWAAPVAAIAALTLGVLWVDPDSALYSVGIGTIRALGVVVAVEMAAAASCRRAFWACVGLGAGHVIGLMAFLLSRWGPVRYQDAYSQLAMRFGVEATVLTMLLCILAMAIAMAWAATVPASGPTDPRR